MLVSLKNKSLVIFFDFVLYSDGTVYSVEDSHILFVDSISNAFKSSILCTRCSPIKGRKGIQISPGLDVLPLPFYKNLPSLLYRKFYTLANTIRLFKKTVKKNDVLWLCWPHPISFLLIFRFAKSNKLFLSVRENLEDVVTEKYKGISRFLGSTLVKFMNYYLRKYQPEIAIFTTGTEMYSKFSPHFRNVFLMKAPLIHDSNYQKKIFNKSKKTINILFTGRLEIVKGLSYLIEAISILKKLEFSVHLDIVGNGVEETRLKSLVKQVDVDNNITFHGYIEFGENLFNFYKNADILVLPALTEGYPKVIDEARAFGLPIITTRSGGMEAELKHGENVWFIEKKSAQAIAEAIQYLSSHPEVKARLSEISETERQTNTMGFYRDKVIDRLNAYLS